MMFHDIQPLKLFQTDSKNLLTWFKQEKMSFLCSYEDCNLGDIEASDERVEIRATLPKKIPKDFKIFKLKWKKNGDAVLHHNCWETITRAVRSRNKEAVPLLCAMEKSLIREAMKTAEFHDSKEKLEKESKRISEMIRKAEYCVVFSGAGISTSAGIGDYRGKSGKWTEEERMASSSSWEAEEDDDLDDGIESKKKKSSDDDDDDDDEDEDEVPEEGVPYEQLRPTLTHEAIYKLFQIGFIKHIISQNGDGLHSLSGFSLEHLSELHGNVFLEKCEKCGAIYERDYYVLDDNGSSYFQELNECGASGIKKPRNARQCEMCGLTHRTGRKCTNKGCKGFLMDTIINFGDDLEEEIFEQATANAKRSDLMLCLGTTLTVTPANELVEIGKKPLRLVICNRQKTSLDKVCLSMDECDRPLGSRVFGDCDLLMRKIMSKLLPAQELQEWENGREERMKAYGSKRTSS